jgi:hypothetical protein
MKAIIISKLRAEQDPSIEEIHNATCGIVFLGTPHKGSDVAWFGVCLAWITAPFFGSNKMLLKSLTYHDAELVNRQFLFSSSCGPQMKICSFYETLPTRFMGFPLGLVGPPRFYKVGYAYKDVQIVNRTSASFDSGDILSNGMDKDHSGLNKFGDRRDPDYEQICSAIRNITEASKSSSYVRGSRQQG